MFLKLLKMDFNSDNYAVGGPDKSGNSGDLLWLASSPTTLSDIVSW
jgi:hypothetical protein